MRNKFVMGIFLSLLVLSAPVAEAGWLRDKIAGTDVKGGIVNYVTCVGAIQAEHSSLSEVLILEGVAEDIPLRMRTEENALSGEEKAALEAAYEELKQCRKALKKTARKDSGMTDVLTTTFNFIDRIYADLISDRVTTATANEHLVRATSRALTKIAELKNIQLDAQRRAGWRMMNEGLGQLNPPSSDVLNNPSYTCYTNGSTTNCSPIRKDSSRSPSFSCYTSGSVTTCKPMQ